MYSEILNEYTKEVRIRGQNRMTLDFVKFADLHNLLRDTNQTVVDVAGNQNQK